MINKPNNPKCDSCFVINNLLRCSICKHRTEEWMRKNMTKMNPVLVGDFDMYQRKKELRKHDPILDKIREEIADTGAYEQEVHGKSEYLKGIDYCLSVIDRYAAESEAVKEE